MAHGEPRVALPRRVDAEAFRRCDPARPVQALGGAGLGTSWRVRFATQRTVSCDVLRAAIARRLAIVVAQISQWAPDSALTRFNGAPPGTWLALPPDFAAVIEAALDVARRSEGAFDPTHGRAAALLGFGALEIMRQPTAAELEDALAAAGWQRLEYDPQARCLRQPGGLWLDFSAIGKGYAVDAVAAILGEHGIEDMLVEIGGELVGRGLKPDGQPWWVDLETPPGVALHPLRIGLHDRAVATSGDYVRGVHTLDPGTGRPIATGAASVSVFHDSAMLADAWATALTVAEPEAATSMAIRETLAARCIRRRQGGVTEWLSPELMAIVAD